MGPFSVADARVYVTQQIFNWSDIKSWKSAAESEQASQYSNKNDRELVVLAAGNAYLTVIADRATVDSTRAQLTTAQALHDRAVDQNRAGVIAAIDVLRARVELQTQQQRLIAAENQLAIDKLVLARVIGLPNGQAFELTDAVPYAPLDGITLDQALERAVTTRPDYLSAKARVRAAELARQAAAAGNYPSLAVDANYGAIGSPNFGTSHGTFSVAVTLNVPIFQGTRVRADTLRGRRGAAAAQGRTGRSRRRDRRAGAHGVPQLQVVIRSGDRGAEQRRSREPDPRAGAGSVRRRRRRTTSRSSRLRSRWPPPTSRTSRACMRTTSRRSLSRRPSASPNSRRCRISESSSHGHIATYASN